MDSPSVGLDRSERIRRVGGVGLGLAVVLAAVLAVLSGLAFGESLVVPWLVTYALGMASISALALGSSRARPKTSPAHVEIHGGVLLVEPTGGAQRRSVPLDDIAQGWEEPCEVRFSTRAGDVVAIGTRTAGEGDRLLRAAGVSAAERVLRVPLTSAAARAPGGIGPISLLLGAAIVTTGAQLSAIAERAHLMSAHQASGSLFEAIAAFVACATVTCLLGTSFRRREAIVGTDGVLVRGRLGARLVRYADLARAIPHRRGVQLLHKNGRVSLLPTLGAEESPLRAELPGPTEPLTDAEARRSALLARIEKAMNASATGAEVWASLDQLDRKGRSLEAWRSDLGRVLAKGTDYRTVGLGPTDLASVIGDASAPTERRIAAAIALSTAQPEEARARVRFAAEACADDDLRRALERAAEGEIDEAVVEREERRVRTV